MEGPTKDVNFMTPEAVFLVLGLALLAIYSKFTISLKCLSLLSTINKTNYFYSIVMMLKEGVTKL